MHTQNNGTTKQRNQTNKTPSDRNDKNQPNDKGQKENASAEISKPETNVSRPRQENPPNIEISKPNRKKRKRTRKNKQLAIAVINVRGIKGKIKSLETALATEKIKIAVITETHLQGDEKPRITGYRWTGKNRKNQSGGGVGILVAQDIAGITTTKDDIETDESTESTWIKISTRPKPIFIGAFYGPQEKTTKQKVEDIYTTLETQVTQLENQGEVLLTGDFNAKLEIRNPQGQQEESRNGKILQQMINRKKLEVTNINPQKGLWTRVNRNNPNEKSVIDYIVTTRGIHERMGATIIDEEGSLRIKGKAETDHNTILTSISINTERERKLQTRWKMGNSNGWAKYNEVIKTKIEANTRTEDTQEMYNKVEKIITSTLEETIGKSTIRTDKPKKTKNEEIVQKRKMMKEKKKLFEEACKKGKPEDKIRQGQEYTISQNELREAIQRQELINLEKKLEKIQEEAKTNPNIIWQLKKKHSTDNSLDYETITEEGELLQEPEKTKNYVKMFYEELYQAQPGTPEYENWTNHIDDTINNLIETHDPNTESQGSEPITNKELNKAIKRLKRGKSCGPDNIPNEAFIEANTETREFFKEAFNIIHSKEAIPKQWQEGTIKRLYKGKGTKGKCSNERGITLASNTGKVFERIINERVIKNVKITEAQAGGKKGAATVDHLITLKEVIARLREENKPVHIIFLDVQKAYDKAWLNGILYALNKNGVSGKNLEITRKLNSNLKAKIQTRHGLTGEINIKDSIRQGGVLSVVEYATLIDEIAKELQTNNQGIDLPGVGKIGCLLWMDDVALIHNDKQELQKMMNTTNEIAKRYHIEFGAPKCKVIRIGKSKPTEIKLGEATLEETVEYKYLGEIFNNKATSINHIEKLKGKVNAAYQNIATTTGNKEFKGIRMKAIWLLIDRCIIPILTYAAEAMDLTKTEQEAIQAIFNNLLKKVLAIPQSTPNLGLLAETGYLPIKYIMERKRIMQANRIHHMKENPLVKQATNHPDAIWTKNTQKIMEKHEITAEEIQMSKPKLKSRIKKTQSRMFTKELQEESKEKSKVAHLLERKRNIQPGTRPKYLETLTRKQCRAIIMARTRMLPVKNNHKGSYRNLTCRWCKNPNKEETQEHILTECQEIKDKAQTNIKYAEIFLDDDTNRNEEIANQILQVLSVLETPPTN